MKKSLGSIGGISMILMACAFVGVMIAKDEERMAKAAAQMSLEIEVEDFGNFLYVSDSYNDRRETTAEFRRRFFTQFQEWLDMHNKHPVFMVDQSIHGGRYYGMSYLVYVETDSGARPMDATP